MQISALRPNDKVNFKTKEMQNPGGLCISFFFEGLLSASRKTLSCVGLSPAKAAGKTADFARRIVPLSSVLRLSPTLVSLPNGTSAFLFYRKEVACVWRGVDFMSFSLPNRLKTGRVGCSRCIKGRRRYA